MISGWKVAPRPAHFLPQGHAATLQLLCSVALGIRGGPVMVQHPWVLVTQKRGLRRDSALNPDPHSSSQPQMQGKQNPP